MITVPVASKLRLLLAWARFKKFAVPVLAALFGALVAFKLRKPEPAKSADHTDRARTDQILADAIRPHVAARVESAKAQAAANVQAAKDAHATALSDAAKVQTATPRELDALLKAYAKKVAQLIVLGWLLTVGTARAQSCDETQCTLSVKLTRTLLADASQAPQLRIEVADLTLANEHLTDAVNAQSVATDMDAAALRSTALELVAAQNRANDDEVRASRFFRQWWFLTGVGLVVGSVVTGAVLR